MSSSRKKYLTALLVSCLTTVAVAPVWAASSPYSKPKKSTSPFTRQTNASPATRAEFDEDVRVASSLMARAEQTLKESRSQDALRVAIGLYVESGKLFEKAAKGYETLLPRGATQEDADNSLKAMQYCIRSIGEIKSRLKAA